jgi:hypothetical protein
MVAPLFPLPSESTTNMKLLTTVTCSIILLTVQANATKYTLSNGNFGNQTSGMSLANGDVIEIPSGSNVTFTSSQTINQDITLDVKGTFNMTPGNKILTLSCGGVANVYPGGTVSGSDASQKIIICSNNVFAGTSTVTSTTTTLTATSNSVGFMSISPLPLKFISFDARLQSTAVSLQWTAMNDGPATMFAIQQSTVGKSWNDIAKVKATGADHETVSYSYDAPAPRSATAIYRLRYLGTNETEVVYSSSRLVNTGKVSNETSAVIGADAGRIQIALNAAERRSATTIMIATIDGRVLYNRQYSPETTSITIPVNEPGILAVTVTDGNSFRITQKVGAL